MPTPKRTIGLTMYRRHGASCDKTEPTYEPTGIRQSKADDCECPIVVDGYLLKEAKRIQRYSLQTPDWAEAAKRKAQLLEWQTLTEPYEVRLKRNGVPSIEQAVEKFLANIDPHGQSTERLSRSTFIGYQVHLNQRLLPFCAAQHPPIVNLAALEDLDTLRTYQRSWKRLEESRQEEPLSLGTKRVELKRLRRFLASCVEHKWINDNAARQIKVRSDEHTSDMARYGMELEEYARVVEYYRQRSGMATMRRRMVLVELMRWTGMRISDAVKFNHTELVESSAGHSAKFVQWKLRRITQTPVTVPMPPHVVELLRSLDPIHIGTDGKGYWFSNLSRGVDITAKAISHRVAEDLAVIQNERPFAHFATGHCLRHTFAIQHLNQGVDLATVSRWLGHGDVATTARYYSHAIQSTLELAERRYHLSVAAQLSTPSALTLSPP